jgi:NAD(P)-dependent dehydrogenase (short-subunit alcohol dehydrogenase family)
VRELKGTTCLVTGCSTGIGRATARALAAEGACVFATARDRSAIAELADDDIETLALDVRDPAAVEAALEATGPVGVLVNNAGFGIEGAVEEIGDADLRDQYETNVFGVWRLCRAVLPGMRERGRGTIVNVSSFGGQAPFPGIGAYRSSKFALEGLTWTLRLEVAHFGIRVLSVQPGLTASRFGDSMRRGEHFDPDGPYAPMRASAAVTYAQMSPTALEPETVADAIVAAIGAEQTPWRIRVGDDARRITTAVESGDEAYERELVEGLGFDWHPLGSA